MSELKEGGEAAPAAPLDPKSKEANPRDKTTGMPIVDLVEVEKGSTKRAIIMPIIMLIFLGIGFGIALAIHTWSQTDKYEPMIALVSKYDF